MINFKTLLGGFFYAFVIVRFRHCEAVCQNVQLTIKVPTAAAIPFFVPSFNETRLYLHPHQ